MQEDPIGAVNHMLQSAGNGNGDWLEGVDDQELLFARSNRSGLRTWCAGARRRCSGSRRGTARRMRKGCASAALANPALKALIAAERQQPIVPPRLPLPRLRGHVARSPVERPTSVAHAKPMMKLETSSNTSSAVCSWLVVVQLKCRSTWYGTTSLCAGTRLASRAAQERRRRGSRLSASARLLDRNCRRPYAAVAAAAAAAESGVGRSGSYTFATAAATPGSWRRSLRSRRIESYQRKIAVHVHVRARRRRTHTVGVDQTRPGRCRAGGPFGCETPRPGREARQGESDFVRVDLQLVVKL